MTKIVFIGRGNAGVFGALHFSYHSDAEVELIYDPNTPPEKVGQASLLEAPDLLWRCFGLNWYDNPIEATPKLGIVYENWGKSKKHFIHPFEFSSTGIQYNPEQLQDYILKNGKFKVTKKNVEPHDIDADYVFDCRGKLPNEDKEYDFLKSPLNSVILGQGQSADPKQNWTRAVATPDGWTFVIPNANNTTSYGYLYNDKCTSDKAAVKNFSSIFNLAIQNFHLNQKVQGFKFKSYLAKKPIRDNVFLSGNRLFFLEPLESTAVQSYLAWYRMCFDLIFNQHEAGSITKSFKEYIHQVENFILWHYQFGSRYKTKFWKEARKFKIRCPKFKKYVDYCKKNSSDYVRDNRLDFNTSLYGQHAPRSFKNWLDNVKK